MKKTLSLLLVLAMVLTSFTAVFAADETEKTPGEILQEIGVLKGNAEGDLMLEKEVSRQDMIVLLSRLLGQEDEAKAFTGETTFKDIEDPYYVPYIAWAQANELTNGVAEGGEAFGFGRSVTQQEVLAFLLRALGYGFDEVEFENVAAKAAELKLIDDAKADLTVASTREVLAELSLKALKTKVKDSDKTLAEKLELTLPEASKLEVKEVVADNLKEIKVVFNKSVDEDSAIDLNNYETDAGDISDAVYSAEDYTVTLTLKEAIDKKDEGDYELTIDGVKDEKTVLDVTKDFTISDNAVPEVVEVVGLGTKAVKVVTSEPVQTAGNSNFKIDGKTVYGTFKAAGRDIVVKTYSDLSIGDHELTVSGLKDYAGFTSVTTKHSFTVVEDKDAPTVAEVKAPALERVIVTFSEDVDDATVNAKTIYWKNGSTKVYPSSYTRLAGNKYSFTFDADDALPIYETTLYIEGVKDYSGNKIEATEVAIKASIDETRPEVKKVEVKSSGKIVRITYTKAVSKDTATDVKNYKILDEDDNKVTISGIKAVDNTLKVFDLTLGKALDADTTYTLKISGIKDNTKYANYMADYSEPLSVTDYDAPQLSSVIRTENKDVYTLTLYFNRAMDLSTVSDPANYLIAIKDNGVTSNKLLSSLDDYDIDVIKSDGSIVVLTIEEDVDDITGVAGLGVKGSNGKDLSNYGEIVPAKDKTEAITLDKKQATAKDTVKLTFSVDIKDAPEDAFVVDADGVTKEIEDVDINGKVVTLTLKDDDALDAGYKNHVTIAKNSDGDTVTAYDGREFEVNSITLDDKIAPTLTTVAKVISNETITLTATFDEDMNSTVISGNPTALKDELTVTAVENGEEVEYTVDSVNTKDNNIVLTVKTTQDALKDLDATAFDIEITPKSIVIDTHSNAANDGSKRTGSVDIKGAKDEADQTAVNAAKTAVEAAVYGPVANGDVNTEDAAKTYVENVIKELPEVKDLVTYVINKVSFNAAEPGVTDGSYVFTVTLSKGSVTSVTTNNLTLTITQ